MTPVFLDTVGLLALWDVSDQWHRSAETAFADLCVMSRPMLTTNYILGVEGVLPQMVQRLVQRVRGQPDRAQPLRQCPQEKI